MGRVLYQIIAEKQALVRINHDGGETVWGGAKRTRTFLCVKARCAGRRCNVGNKLVEAAGIETPSQKLSDVISLSYKVIFRFAGKLLAIGL